MRSFYQWVLQLRQTPNCLTACHLGESALEILSLKTGRTEPLCLRTLKPKWQRDTWQISGPLNFRCTRKLKYCRCHWFPRLPIRRPCVAQSFATIPGREAPSVVQLKWDDDLPHDPKGPPETLLLPLTMAAYGTHQTSRKPWCVLILH